MGYFISNNGCLSFVLNKYENRKRGMMFVNKYMSVFINPSWKSFRDVDVLLLIA